MPDPSTLADMDRLAARLAAAIANNERVALRRLRRRRRLVLRPDGALSQALRTSSEVYIPDRIFEGYGPNIAAIDKLIGNGASLLITLDCGTVSDGPIAHAKERGIDVLVIDHHLSDHDLPGADALVNPGPAGRYLGAGLSVRRGCDLHGAGGHQPRAAAARRHRPARPHATARHRRTGNGVRRRSTVRAQPCLRGARARRGAAAGQQGHWRAGPGGAGDGAAQSVPSRLSRRPADQCRRPHRRCVDGHAAADGR